MYWSEFPVAGATAGVVNVDLARNGTPKRLSRLWLLTSVTCALEPPAVYCVP